MKYEDTNIKYEITAGKFKGRIVQSYNAEEFPYGHKYRDLGWSQGFTHFKDAQTNEPIGHCGVQWFEENTEEVMI